MELVLRSGYSVQDRLFDLPDEDQRAYVASCMGLPPDQVEWPLKIINNLLGIRKTEGEDRFYTEIRRMMSPEPF